MLCIRNAALGYQCHARIYTARVPRNQQQITHDKAWETISNIDPPSSSNHLKHRIELCYASLRL